MSRGVRAESLLELVSPSVTVSDSVAAAMNSIFNRDLWLFSQSRAVKNAEAQGKKIPFHLTLVLVPFPHSLVPLLPFPPHSSFKKKALVLYLHIQNLVVSVLVLAVVSCRLPFVPGSAVF